MIQPMRNELYSSHFWWHEGSNAMFVKYQPKRNKSVCLLSTMHSAPDVDNDSTKKKPNVILFHNRNKVDVGCFDQMTRLDTARAASRRWPFAVWGNMLDIAAINAKILFVKLTGEHTSRRQFIFERIKYLRNEPESAPVSNLALPHINVPAQPFRKRRKCHGKDCNNATLCLCLNCNK